MWQDQVLMWGNWVFAMALIPTVVDNVREARCAIPYKTSVPTALVLFVFTYTFYTLALTYAVLSAFFVGFLWAMIALQRKLFGNMIL